MCSLPLNPSVILPSFRHPSGRGFRPQPFSPVFPSPPPPSFTSVFVAPSYVYTSLVVVTFVCLTYEVEDVSSSTVSADADMGFIILCWSVKGKKSPRRSPRRRYLEPSRDAPRNETSVLLRERGLCVWVLPDRFDR